MAGDLFDLSRRIHFAQEKLYVWESFSEEAKNARKQTVGKGWNKSNRERAAFSAVDPARSSRIIVRILKQPSAPLQKTPTGKG